MDDMYKADAKNSDTSSQKNEESEIHYTKNKKIIYWAYLLLAFFAVGVQIFLLVTNWNLLTAFSQSDNYYFANQVTVEWQKGFITDIMITADTDCPNNYEHAFSFNWPGTSFGCYCEADKNNTFVLEGYCSPSLIQSNCTNIGSQAERDAHYWKNGSNICVKRSSVSFFNEEKYNGNNKMCGSSDSLVIVPSGSSCPIVNLTFGVPTLEQHYNNVSDSSNLLDPLYATFNATSPFSFYSYPISKFAVSEHQFCLIDEDSGLDPLHFEFVLLDLARGCEEQGNYSNLSSITEIEFYANNQNLNNLSSNLGFPKPGNWLYYLGFASYPSWTYQCRHLYDNKFSMTNAIQNINYEFYPYYNGVAIAQLIILIILAMQVLILMLRRCFKKQVYPVGFKQVYLPFDFCAAFCRYLIDFVCKFGLLGLALFMAWKSYENWNWFKAATNLDCSNGNRELIDYVINPYTQLYENSLIYSVGHIALLAFVFAIDIIHFCYIYRNELQHYLVDSVHRELVQQDTSPYDEFMKDKDLKGNNEEKMLAIEEIGDEEKTQEFRVTMNIFEKEDKEDEIPTRGKIVNKKKKKKFGGLKKQEEKLPNEKSLQISDDFNPYNLQDPSLLALNSRDKLSSPGKKSTPFEEVDEEEIVRNRKKGRGRGRRK